MTQIFDSKSGARERLFLLSVLEDPNDTANWAYNPHHDTWHSASVGSIKVRYEAAESLARLANRGIDRKTALEMAGYPER